MDQESYDKYLHRPTLTKIELTQNIKELVDVTEVLRNRLNETRHQTAYNHGRESILEPQKKTTLRD